jgi:mRNA-degrading endonuclease RelE of RelBE toxin-antitoxin system
VKIFVSSIAIDDRDRVGVKVWRKLQSKIESGAGRKPLSGPYAGLHRVRVGDWRAVIEVHGDDLVLVLVVAHRSEVYDILGQRPA